MASLAGSGLYCVGLAAMLVGVYFSPLIIGMIRGVEHMGVVFALNVLPQFWVAAWVVALMDSRPRPVVSPVMVFTPDELVRPTIPRL